MKPEEEMISWEVLTHVHRERTNDWYWALGLVAVVAAGLSIWLGNFLFGVLILLCSGSIGALAMRGPREHLVEIDPHGVWIDGTLYPYRSLKSFWVDYGDGQPLPSGGREARLYLTTSGLIMPHVTLPLDDEHHASAVHAYLVTKVEEVEQEPHIGEHLVHLLGL